MEDSDSKWLITEMAPKEGAANSDVKYNLFES
jgi:hypothetical protein